MKKKMSNVDFIDNLKKNVHEFCIQEDIPELYFSNFKQIIKLGIGVFSEESEYVEKPNIEKYLLLDMLVDYTVDEEKPRSWVNWIEKICEDEKSQKNNKHLFYNEKNDKNFEINVFSPHWLHIGLVLGIFPVVYNDRQNSKIMKENILIDKHVMKISKISKEVFL